MSVADGRSWTLAERRDYQRAERAMLEPELAAGLAEEPTCRECGCSDSIACPDGCYWVEEDLCSACAAELGGEA